MLLLNPCGFITIIAGKDWDFYFFEVKMRAGIPFHKDHTQTCHHLSFIALCALNLVQSLHILLRSRKAKTSSKKLKLLSLAWAHRVVSIINSRIFTIISTINQRQPATEKIFQDNYSKSWYSKVGVHGKDERVVCMLKRWSMLVIRCIWRRKTTQVFYRLIPMLFSNA